MSKPFLLPVHVVGVAGVGMSAIAQLLRELGVLVTGSDRLFDSRERYDALDILQESGVHLFPQDGSGITSGHGQICVSTAIEEGNPDCVKAERLGLPVVHRSELLAQLCNTKRSIVVTGSAGKTTTTGMIGWILEQAGLDPTVVNGGCVGQWRAPGKLGNVRVGKSDVWVVEADESDKSCLRFHPDFSVITNLSGDHFPVVEVNEIFKEFSLQAKESVILGPNFPSSLEGEHVERVSGKIFHRGVCHGDSFYSVPLPGLHNSENALIAVHVCRTLGINSATVARGLASFPGIVRRLEQVGDPRTVPVYDDYAHNPEKIAAAWRAVAQDMDRVVGIWRPHGFGPLAHLFDGLVHVLNEVMGSEDRLLVLPVYYAGGTTSGSRTSEDLVQALVERGRPVELVEDAENILGLLSGKLAPGAAVLVMGARDPGLPGLARAIAKCACGNTRGDFS